MYSEQLSRRVSRHIASVTQPLPASFVWLDAILLAGACILLAFGVLAFGAVQPWAICALECGAAVLLALWAFQQVITRRMQLTSSAVVPGLILLLIPLLQLAMGRTAYAYATRYELLQWIAYGVFFLVGAEASGNSSFRRNLAIAIAMFGSIYATFAIIQTFTTAPDLLYGVVKTHGSGFGSYTNRNHYAGLMEMLFPFGLVISISKHSPSPIRALSMFGSLVMVASIFASGSRGGIVAATVALSFFTVCYWRQERTTSAARTILLAVVVAAIFITFFSYDRLARRSAMEATDLVRFRIALDSIRLVARHPLLGSGLGTFTSVYPSVRSFPLDLFVNAAHNDYLQLTVETGLVGMCAMTGFVLLVIHDAIRHISRSFYSWFSAVTLAALTGCIALLVHGVFDFNFQIPANAAIFAFLAGLAAARPDRRRSQL